MDKDEIRRTLDGDPEYRKDFNVGSIEGFLNDNPNNCFIKIGHDYIIWRGCKRLLDVMGCKSNDNYVMCEMCRRADFNKNPVKEIKEVMNLHV